jgi:hypothetical protein
MTGMIAIMMKDQNKIVTDEAIQQTTIIKQSNKNKRKILCTTGKHLSH